MSDKIRFNCDDCGKRLSASSKLAGRRVKCACGKSHLVPGGPARKPSEPVNEPDEDDDEDEDRERPLWQTVTAYDPDPNPFVFLLAGALVVVPSLLIPVIPWIFTEAELFETRFLLPALVACPLFSIIVVLLWRRKYKSVPVVELLPRLLEMNRNRLTSEGAKTAERIREIGTVLSWTDGPNLMRQVYDAVRRSELREAWVGIKGWPDSWADTSVDELAGLLSRESVAKTERDVSVIRDRIIEIGREVYNFGGAELMRKVCDGLRARGVVFWDAAWNGIGHWVGTHAPGTSLDELLAELQMMVVMPTRGGDVADGVRRILGRARTDADRKQLQKLARAFGLPTDR